MPTLEQIGDIGYAVFRYTVLTAAIAVYGGLAYLISLDFRSPMADLNPYGAVDVVRDLILVPGLIPLAITAAWAVFAARAGTGAKGLGFIVLSIVIHYVLFAFAAHDHQIYWWIQSAEIAFGVYAIRVIIRPLRSARSR